MLCDNAGCRLLIAALYQLALIGRSRTNPQLDDGFPLFMRWFLLCIRYCHYSHSQWRMWQVEGIVFGAIIMSVQYYFGAVHGSYVLCVVILQ